MQNFIKKIWLIIASVSGSLYLLGDHQPCLQGGQEMINGKFYDKCELYITFPESTMKLLFIIALAALVAFAADVLFDVTEELFKIIYSKFEAVIKWIFKLFYKLVLFIWKGIVSGYEGLIQKMKKTSKPKVKSKPVPKKKAAKKSKSKSKKKKK